MDNFNELLNKKTKPVKPDLLYIDDDYENLSSFKFQFMDYYNITIAKSAEQGYAELIKKTFPIIIADQRMPGMTGTQFFEKILPEFPKTKRMILTGYSDFQSIIDAINKGQIYYYLQKPWNEKEVILVIKNALESLEFERKNDELIHLLTHTNEKLEKSKKELQWRIEETLSAEERYRDLFDNNPIAVIEMDFSGIIPFVLKLKAEKPDSIEKYFDENPEYLNEFAGKVHLVDFNRAALSFWGIERKSELRKRLPALLRSGSRDTFLKVITGIFNGERIIEFETEIKNFKGEKLVANITFSVSPGFSEDYSRTLFSLTDITRRKAAEMALSESERKFRTTFEQAPVAMHLSDIDGSLIMVNKSMADIVEYSQEELIGRTLSEFTHPEDSELSLKNQKSLFLHEISQIRFEKRYICKSGKIIWVDIHSVLIQDINDKPMFAVTHAIDITERKRIMEDLILAKERAEQADKLKSEFLAQVSHEIRTPMNSMLGFTSYLRDNRIERTREDIDEFIEVVHSSGKRLIRTVELLLNTAQLEVGLYEPTFRELDLEEILEKLLREFTPAIELKELVFKYSAEIKGIMVYADEYSVDQIFSNVLDNAIKYTSSGSITLDLTLDKSNGNIIAELADTGIGMSEEFLSNLFRPFTQEERGYSRSFDGNGLGLCLVKNYCDINNITIGVNSRKNEGTSITLAFRKKN